jgi:hypothetical protein
VNTLETAIISEQFNLVLMVQVIAHLYDLNESIGKISGSILPGGYLLVETWNKDSLTAKLFGKNWHEYSPPSTLHFFSKKTLTDLLSQYGFIWVDGGRPSKKIHSKHAKALLKAKFSSSRLLACINPLLSIIPEDVLIPYPAEDLFWALFKKNT